MTKIPYKRREAPFSLRLNFDERAKLEKQAGNMPLSAYIKSLLFSEDAPSYRQRRRSAEVDEQLLAEVLACLGASQIGKRLETLSTAAESGSLYFDADTKSDIKRACDDVKAMRLLLMQALGMKTDEQPREKESTSQAFTRAASAKPTFRNRKPNP